MSNWYQVSHKFSQNFDIVPFSLSLIKHAECNIIGCTSATDVHFGKFTKNDHKLLAPNKQWYYLQNTFRNHVNWIYRYFILILHLVVAVKYCLQNTFKIHVIWFYRYFRLILYLIAAVRYHLQNTLKTHVNWINRYFRLILKPLVTAINTGRHYLQNTVEIHVNWI